MNLSELRVLFLPINYMAGGRPYTGAMADAWNNLGVQWKLFDFVAQWERTNDVAGLQTDLIKMVGEFQPHLMHMQLQYTGLIEPKTLVECRKLVPNVVMTNWTGDIRENLSYFVNIAPAVDFSLISSTGQLELYRNAGCHNAAYWQIGFDPKVAYPERLSDFKYDCSFIGHNYGNTPDFKENIRLPVAHRLHSNYGERFGLFGSGFGNLNNNRTCTTAEANHIYNESVCPISISNVNSIAHYFSDRLLFCLASGRPTISWHYPECEDDFVGGKELFYAKSDNDIIDIVAECKRNPAMAKAVGEAGYQKVLNNHTYTHRAKELLKITGFIDG